VGACAEAIETQAMQVKQRRESLSMLVPLIKNLKQDLAANLTLHTFNHIGCDNQPAKQAAYW
jgi:hypothetical protein